MKKIVLRNGRTMRCPTFLLCIAAVLLAVGVLAAYTQSKDIDGKRKYEFPMRIAGNGDLAGGIIHDRFG